MENVIVTKAYESDNVTELILINESDKDREDGVMCIMFHIGKQCYMSSITSLNNMQIGKAYDDIKNPEMSAKFLKMIANSFDQEALTFAIEELESHKLTS